jgi:hypothetical protein
VSRRPIPNATPVPCGTARPTTQRPALAGRANTSYCACHFRWYWALKLQLVTTTHGLADPKLGEREGAVDLLAPCPRARDAPAGGGAHRRQGLLLQAVSPPGRAAEALLSARGTGATNIADSRQLIQSAYDTGKGQLSHASPGGCLPGCHLAQPNTGAPVARSLIACDH